MSAGQWRQCQRNAAFRELLAASAAITKLANQTTKPQPVRVERQKPIQQQVIPLPCIHRSEHPIQNAACGCSLYDCELHDECVVTRKKASGRLYKLKDGIHVCDECPDRRIAKGESFTRHLIYHIYPIAGNGAWQRNVSRLCERLRIFNGKIIVTIAIDPPEGRKPDPTGPFPPDRGRCDMSKCDTVETVKAAFGDWAQYIEFIVWENDPNLREAGTLIPMLERLSSGPNDITLYAQAKGTTRHPHHIANHWCDVMYILYFDYMKLVEEQLQQYACTGAFKKLGPGWSATQSKSDWHYSGSFVWFRNAELFKRDWRKIDSFWSGIEPYPSQHFECKEAGCLFYEAPNSQMRLYRSKHWSKTVNPMLAKWRIDNVKYFNGSHNFPNNLMIAQMREAMAKLPDPPKQFDHEQAVCTLTSPKYHPGTYVTLKMLRHVGYNGPVIVWHKRAEPLPKCITELAECRTVESVVPDCETEFKQWHRSAILLSNVVRKVFWMDADSYPVKPIDNCFADLKHCGCVFWQDVETGDPFDPAMYGLKDANSFTPQGGNLLFDLSNRNIYQGVALAHWFNVRERYYFPGLVGDQTQLRAAWALLGLPSFRYSQHPVQRTHDVVFLHQSPEGDPLIVHRTGAKFAEPGVFPLQPATRFDDLPLEDVAWGYFQEFAP